LSTCVHTFEIVVLANISYQQCFIFIKTGVYDQW